MKPSEENEAGVDLEEEERKLLEGSPPEVPSPRWSWVAAGAGIVIAGVIVSLSMVMLAIGLLMCVVGVGMVAASFLSSEGREMRLVSSRGKERFLAWIPQEREPTPEEKVLVETEPTNNETDKKAA